MPDVSAAGFSGYRYWAFISYSSRDAAHAKWLHRAIETYGIPAKVVKHGHTTPVGEPAPPRFRPIFRDRDELPAAADLGNAIEGALAASRYLIVVCSPHAAQSRWVNREVETFADLGRRGRVFAFIVSGEPNSDDAQECFPPALKQQEPLAADARRQGDGRNDAKLKLVAGMLGVSFDELKRRETQRRLRSLQLVTAVALVLVLAFAGLAWYADQQRVDADRARQQAVAAKATAVTEAQVRATAEANAVSESRVRATAQAVAEEQRQVAVAQKNEAERQARLALSGQLAIESRTLLGNSPDLALLLAAESLNTYDAFQARSTLLSSLLQSPHLDRILRIPENVTALAFSPDGKTLASAACTSRNAAQECKESAFQFWDLATGLSASQPIPALPGLIWGLVVAPDGKSLFVGGTAGAIRQWDIVDRHFAAEYALNETAVTSLAVTADGRYLAAGNCHALNMPGGLCEGGGLGVWDLTASETVSVTMDGRAPGSQGLASSPDGHWVVTGDCARVEQDNLKVDRCVQGEVRRWRLPDGARERYTVTASKSAIQAVVFTPDGKTLFAGDANGLIHLLNAKTMEATGAPFQAQGSSVSGLLVSSQLGGMLIAGTSSQPPQVWRLGSASPIATSLAARQGLEYTFVRSLALSPDGNILATATCPGGAGPTYPCPPGSEIHLWDLVLWQPAEQVLMRDPPGKVEIALPADSLPRVALIHSGGELRQFDLSTNKPAGKVLFKGDETLLVVRLSPDGRRAATIDCIQRDPNYKTPFCLETEIRLWDAVTWQPLGQPARVGAWVLHATFSPDASKLAVDGPDDTVIVLDAATGAQVQTIVTGINAGFRELSFASDSTGLAVSGCLHVEGKLLCQDHDVVRVFDLANGQETGTMIGPFDAQVTALAMGPASRHNVVAVAVGSFSKHEWGLWDWQSGAQAGQAVQGGAGALAFSPDGRFLAVTGDTTTLWDLAEQQAVGAPLTGNGGELRQVVFSPDSTQLIANSSAGLVSWSLAPADWRRRACHIANRNLTAEEWKKYVGDAAFRKTCPELP